MKGEPVRYEYKTNLSWSSEKKGILHSKDKPDIGVACPPEFGGHPNIWSPEDLFLGSVEICTMTTALWFANKEHLDLVSYQSNATGIVEMVHGVFQFSSITVKVKLEICSEGERSKAEKIMKKTEKACLITNSIQTSVTIDATIVVKEGRTHKH